MKGTKELLEWLDKNNIVYPNMIAVKFTRQVRVFDSDKFNDV